MIDMFEDGCVGFLLVVILGDNVVACPGVLVSVLVFLFVVSLVHVCQTCHTGMN